MAKDGDGDGAGLIDVLINPMTYVILIEAEGSTNGLW